MSQPMHPNDVELFEYVEGELEAAAVDRIRAHLDACPDCAAIVRLSQVGGDALRSAPTFELPAARRAAVLDALPAQERIERERRGLAAWLTPRRALAVLAPAAVAAVIAVAVVNTDVGVDDREAAAPAEPAAAPAPAEAAAPAEPPSLASEAPAEGATEAAPASGAADASGPELSAPAEDGAPAADPSQAPAAAAEAATAAPVEEPGFEEPAAPAEEPAAPAEAPAQPAPPAEEPAPPPGAAAPDAGEDLRTKFGGEVEYASVQATVDEVLALLEAAGIEAVELEDGTIGVGGADQEQVGTALASLPAGELRVVGQG